MSEAKLPRCIAYLSLAGDLITLELASGPAFTTRDVEAIVQVLRADRAKLRDDVAEVRKEFDERA